MDAKFHKRDAVAIYKQLDKDNFSWLIHSYIKIEYKFVRTTAVHVYWESFTVGKLDKNIFPYEFCRKYFFIETYIMVAMVALVALSKIIIN